MRARLLVPLIACALLVPSGADPAGADVFSEGRVGRTDTVVVSGVECEVHSVQELGSDGTVTLSTVPSSASGTDAEACFRGAVETRVRYTYRDADGDVQSGEAVSPRVVVVTLPAEGMTDVRSFHRTVWFDGTTSPEFPLPK